MLQFKYMLNSQAEIEFAALTVNRETWNTENVSFHQLINRCLGNPMLQQLSLVLQCLVKGKNRLSEILGWWWWGRTIPLSWTDDDVFRSLHMIFSLCTWTGVKECWRPSQELKPTRYGLTFMPSWPGKSQETSRLWEKCDCTTTLRTFTTAEVHCWTRAQCTAVALSSLLYLSKSLVSPSGFMPLWES